MSGRGDIHGFGSSSRPAVRNPAAASLAAACLSGLVLALGTLLAGQTASARQPATQPLAQTLSPGATSLPTAAPQTPDEVSRATTFDGNSSLAPADSVIGNDPVAPVVAGPRFSPPQDPRLARVYSIFDTHCASCHQTGKLTAPSPAGPIADILDLEHLARTHTVVRGGEPDASVLYQTLLDRHKPLDFTADGKWPTPDDINRVRTWIEEIPARAPSCNPPQIISPAVMAAAIDDAILAAGPAGAQELRFITLSHLANACADAKEMEAYRQGISKLLNSLSWGARPVVPVAIDDAKTILSFKLSDIGWVDEHWAMLARAEPTAFAIDLAGKLQNPSANTRPIRGDWFAMMATRPPFYADLLGLPPTLDETARLLGIVRATDTASKRDMRAGLRTSTMSRSPRIIERYQVDTRRLWLVHDFADGTNETDVFERPLGGVRGAPERLQFRSDGQRAIFSLPNGFLGFALFDAEGRRIDQLAVRLEPDATRSLGPTVAASACLSCHTAGLQPFTGDMRNHLASDKFTGARDVKEQALVLYDTAADWARVLDADLYGFRRAQIQAAINPDLLLYGQDPLTALAQRYGQSVDLADAAAEAHRTLADFEQALQRISPADRPLALRLRQGLLPRNDTNQLLAAVAGLSSAQTPQARIDEQGAGTNGAIRLALWTNQVAYNRGDLLTVYAQSSAPCHLTLISVNSTGKATVLFPSEFDPENLIRPETPFSLPDGKAQYQFRLKDTGVETIIGRCQTAAKFPAGIEPDYERQRFTVLGNYENFLRTSFSLDSEMARTRANDRARPARTPAPRDAAPAPREAGKDAKPETKPDLIARAAVRITVQ